MVKRCDDKGILSVVPPYSSAEQKVLGDKPPFPAYVQAEKYSLSIAFAVEEHIADYDVLSADAHLCDIEVVLYFEGSAVIGGGNTAPRVCVGRNNTRAEARSRHRADAARRDHRHGP
jgi:hypothetical protein